MAAAAPASRDRAASANGDAPRANGRRGGGGGARGWCLRRLRPEGGAGAGAGPAPQRSRDTGGTPAGRRDARELTAAPSRPAATALPGPAPEEGEGEAAVAGRWAARLESEQGPKRPWKEGLHLQGGKKPKLILIKRSSPTLYPKRLFRGNCKTLSIRNGNAYSTLHSQSTYTVRDFHHPSEVEF